MKQLRNLDVEESNLKTGDYILFYPNYPNFFLPKNLKVKTYMKVRNLHGQRWVGIIKRISKPMNKIMRICLIELEEGRVLDNIEIKWCVKDNDFYLNWGVFKLNNKEKEECEMMLLESNI